MKKALLIALLGVTTISSCKKDDDDYEALTEPISLINPTSATINLSNNETLNIEVRYLTDQAINYVQTFYEINTSPSVSSVYTYPDTLANVILDSDESKLTNRYTYTGSYTVPGILPPNSVIRFKTILKANNKQYNKEFKIVVN